MRRKLLSLMVVFMGITCMACGNKDTSDENEVNYVEVSDTIHDFRGDYEYKLEEIQEYLDEGHYDSAIDELILLKEMPEFQEFIADIDSRILEAQKLSINSDINTINEEYEVAKDEEGIGQAAFDQIVKIDNLKDAYPENLDIIDDNIESAIRNNYDIIMESADKSINENITEDFKNLDYFVDTAIPLLEDAIEQVNTNGLYDKYAELVKERVEYLSNYRQECAVVQYIDKPNFDHGNCAYHPKYSPSAYREYESKDGGTYLDFWVMVVQQTNNDNTRPYVTYDFNNKHEDLEIEFFCNKVLDDNKRFYLEVYADDELVATSEEIGSNSGNVVLKAKINKCDKVKIVAIRTDHNLSLDRSQPSVGIVSILGYNENKPELVPYTPYEVESEVIETEVVTNDNME